MANTTKKEVYLIVALNEVTWYAKEDVQERIKKLPLTYQYSLRKNMKELAKMVEEFNSFKAEQEQVLRDTWFDTTHSDEITTTDDQGNEIPARKIKEEYFEDYQKAVKDLNGQLEKLLSQTEEISYTPFDIDALVEVAGNDSINIDDVDMISLFAE